MCDVSCVLCAVSYVMYHPKIPHCLRVPHTPPGKLWVQHNHTFVSQYQELHACCILVYEADTSENGNAKAWSFVA